MLPKYLITETQADSFLKDHFESNTYSRIGVIVDENTKEYCYPLVQDSIPSHELLLIRSGEIHKNLDTCKEIWDTLTDSGFDRHSIIINLGGGVIGDMGGFCASTFKRGMKFINIPTTLLSQVDASIGGKLGVDYGEYKNHIGVFHDPLYVVIDDRFLQTIPEKEMLSGYAEIIKHSLIADPDQWKSLSSQSFPLDDWRNIIAHSIGIKSDIVQKDPFESGLRKILNFGHTLGHAVESHFLNDSNPLLHGEAIAVGMIMESYLSMKLNGLDNEEFLNILNYLKKTYGHRKIGSENYEAIYQRTLQDKKNVGKTVKAVLLNKVGQPADAELEKEVILEAIEFYDNI